MRALLAEREAAYAAVPKHLDTGRLSVSAAVERVLGLAADLPEGGHRLVVKTGESARPAYDILIAEDLLAQAGSRLVAAGLRPGRCAVVTNPNVASHHLAALRDSLAAAGFEPIVCEVPDGEVHKTLATVAGLYERLAEARLSREEGVIALGGGVIGDTAGFVAATWLRGVPFVQIPTSLLSMVDASVGGKVAVDLPQGKNLVGAFKQPDLVLMDPAVLGTLPAGEFRSGLAEVLKTAVIGDPALFEALAGPGPDSLTAMIADTVRVKAVLVERDPYERGDRAWLNLGHTFGHALELVSDYTLRHGEGVALGMVAAAELSAGLGYCEPALVERTRSTVARLGLPVVRQFDPELVLDAMGTDKKRRGRSLRFILPLRIGEVAVVEDVPAARVMRALASISLPSDRG
jgi:3-dehydroquinate synthase